MFFPLITCAINFSSTFEIKTLKAFYFEDIGKSIFVYNHNTINVTCTLKSSQQCSVFVMTNPLFITVVVIVRRG